MIQPFDQDRWAATYDAFDAASALAVFTAVRSWNVRLIGRHVARRSARRN